MVQHRGRPAVQRILNRFNDQVSDFF